MVRKSVMAAFIMLVLLFGFAHNVSAEKITAKLGGSRMVLRLAPGEVERKSITVINDNSIPMKIELATSGELAGNIKLEEESFELAPETEKKVYFQIKAPLEEVTTESKIDVKYIPEEGNGVGLSAVVIVIASGEAVNEEFEFEEISDDNSGVFNFAAGNDLTDEESSANSKFQTSNILFISTLLLFVVLVILAVYAVKVKKKRSVGGPRA